MMATARVTTTKHKLVGSLGAQQKILPLNPDEHPQHALRVPDHPREKKRFDRAVFCVIRVREAKRQNKAILPLADSGQNIALFGIGDSHKITV